MVESEKSETYIRCRNCGIYFHAETGAGKYYCSLECTNQFTRCVNCGKFFPRASTGPTSGEAEGDQTGADYCSDECRLRYKLKESRSGKARYVPLKEPS